jgi:hypothetical protein
MSNDARQPKGIREGGQFAASQNPESTVDLDDVFVMSREGRFCVPLIGPDVVGSPEYRMLLGYAYDSAASAFKAGLTDDEAMERIAAALDETIREAELMKARLVGNAPSTVDTEFPSPYAEFEGVTAADVRKQLADLPDDEPLLYWTMSRDDATSYASEYLSDGSEVTPEQWVKIFDRFGEKTDHEYGPWATLHEVFNESVDAVIPQWTGDDEEDEPTTRNMNSDDFCDLYQPITNPRSRESDQFEILMFLDYGEDLDFVRRQSSDYVWSRRRNKYNDTEIVNGYYPESEGYFVTLMPWSDEYDYVVSN